MARNHREILLRRRLNRRRRNGDSLASRLFLALTLAVLLFGGMVFAGGVATATGAYYYYTRALPPPEAIQAFSQLGFQTSKIYDRTGTVVLWEIFDPRWGNREVVPLSRIPLHLRQATIALEDRDFYTNPGVNLRGLVRGGLVTGTGLICELEALFPLCKPLSDLFPGFEAGAIQGGSSITQQLVKNVVIPLEERFEISIERKIKEVLLALELTRRYEKDQILEWYLNTVHYGNLAYGVEAAAQAYFGKHVWELDLAESALLAGLPQSPGANNPLVDRERAREVQTLVLEAMYRDGYITRSQTTAAKAEFDRFVFHTRRFPITAPHFVDYVRQVLEEKYGTDRVLQGGLRVYTTIDLSLQRAAEEACSNHLTVLQEQNRNVTNCAVVTINPRTGEILAMVGSPDYWNEEIDGQVNNALSLRQPGSSIKVFTYSTVFLQGYTPATMIMDVRTTFDDYPNPPYSPENHDRVYRGPLRLRQALGNSINVPAVRVLQEVEIPNMLATAHRLGINSLTEEGRYGLSLTLGGGEVRLLDMTYAYGVFANGGIMAGQPVPPERQRPGFRTLDPVAVLRVEDAQGNVLEEYRTPQTQQVLDPRVAYLITSILSDPSARSLTYAPGGPLELSRRAAVKTGTTDDYRDAWTIGYTPQIVTGVWVGNADNKPMVNVFGSRGAAPIWHEVMEAALANLPIENFVEPPGIVRAEVDATSGLLPTEYSPSTVQEIFIEGTVPATYDNIHQAFRIFRPTARLATASCPLDQVDVVVFAVYPPEAADWVRDNNIPQPPSEYEPSCGPSPIFGDVAITSPRPYAYLGGLVPLMGSARGDGFQLYRLQYGEGLNPTAWFPTGGDHFNQVDNGFLENWDTAFLPEGLYSLQLTVIRGGQTQTATVQVSVDNTPPQVEITYPPENTTFIAEEDEWVILHAEATDNFSIDRVEFFMDGNLLFTDTVSPYNQRWTIPSGASKQTHCLWVVAYDGAGRSTESGRVRFQIVTEEEAEQGVPTELPPCPAPTPPPP